jgi:hypothetical protein
VGCTGLCREAAIERLGGKVGGLDADLEEASVGSDLDLILVAVAVVALALLVALRLPLFGVDLLVAGLGGLGAAVLGVKVVVMAWAVGTRRWSAYPAPVVTTYAD